ncbi:hypothetical protein VTK73DRAFT_8573 [Phialemonium thermophilum]|uniref:CENP-V/GFA domain-containing protein n=1 Tax=Phialemonium thermophilum TaxID=223376 RepID=A0ABR3W8E3_9PEZI
MSKLYTGQCLCGGVRLSAASPPVAVLSCFCRHCSKGSGGTHQVIAKFADKDIQVEARDGALETYTFDDTGSGLPKDKVFCRICGVPMWTVPGHVKGRFLMVRAAVIDSGPELKPQFEIYTKYRPSWVPPVEGASQWQEMRVE